MAVTSSPHAMPPQHLWDPKTKSAHLKMALWMRVSPWGIFPIGRRVPPMLAVCATTTVVVTVAAGTRCTWYGLTGPLDAEKLPPGIEI